MKDIRVAGKIIYVVDDDLAVLTFVQVILERADMATVQFLNGEDMLKGIGQQLPDLILLDIDMPQGMNGFEVCRHLKSDDILKDIPIIFLSGAADAKNKVKGFELGAKDYIPKPVLPGELIARVKTHLVSSQLEKDLKRSEAKYKSMMEAMMDCVYIISPEGIVEYMNPVMIKRIGKETVGETCHCVFQGLNQPCEWCEFGKALTDKSMGIHFVSPMDQQRYHMTHMPIYHDKGRVSTMVVMRDETEYWNTLEAKKRSEYELMQAQKMKSIAQLATGLAHEINTPIQYSIDNMGFLATAFSELIAAAKAAQDLLDAVKSGEVAQGLVEKIERILEKADLEYHGEEIPLAIQQSIEGENQVATIVQSMKEFSKPGEEKVLTDINHALENTITISRNEWKSVSEVISEFDTLPLVSCWPNEINQVFLNLIINAAETIENAIGKAPKTKGQIHIKTQNKGTFVQISFRDTGVGISNENQPRVFDPFFTTKEVGEGTGQGLYVSYNVIEKKHKGKLQCNSEPGKGSTFIVSLPV